MIIPNVLIDALYNQTSWHLQTSDTPVSYEHLKFSYGACSPVLHLCLVKEQFVPSTLRHSPGWLVLPHWPSAGSVTTAEAQILDLNHCPTHMVGFCHLDLNTHASKWACAAITVPKHLDKQYFRNRNKPWTSSMPGSNIICILAPRGKNWVLAPPSTELSIRQSFSQRNSGGTRSQWLWMNCYFGIHPTPSWNSSSKSALLRTWAGNLLLLKLLRLNMPTLPFFFHSGSSFMKISRVLNF